jgi:hypothetical protein
MKLIELPKFLLLVVSSTFNISVMYPESGDLNVNFKYLKVGYLFKLEESLLA